MRNGSCNTGKVDLLLIEDSPQDITSTLNALKKANITNTVHVLQNPAEVFDFLSRIEPQPGQAPLPETTIILLSLTLDKVHGLDVLRKLKADERTKSLPVIILSSSQEERGVMQSYKLGASGCIVKPVDLPKFVEAISELRLGWVLVAPDTSGAKSGGE
jgi:two-component system response regulator